MDLVESSLPYQRIDPSAAQRILVLGDSTAVGTGVHDPALSTAGRLGSHYPYSEVINLSKNGMRLRELVSIVKNLKQHEHYDLILVQIGANDIIRLTPMRDVERDAEVILRKLREHSDTVVLLHSGNIGNAPFFPHYYRPVLSKRSLEVREIYTKLATAYGVTYIDLISSGIDTLMSDNPETYYAADKLHLSGEGYGLWYEEIEKSLSTVTL